jgi:hypothetical protein
VPSHDRVGLDDDGSVQQRRHKAIKADEVQTICGLQPGTGQRGQDDELLPEIDDLGFTLCR